MGHAASCSATTVVNIKRKQRLPGMRRPEQTAQPNDCDQAGEAGASGLVCQVPSFNGLIGMLNVCNSWNLRQEEQMPTYCTARSMTQGHEYQQCHSHRQVRHQRAQWATRCCVVLLIWRNMNPNVPWESTFLLPLSLHFHFIFLRNLSLEFFGDYCTTVES